MVNKKIFKIIVPICFVLIVIGIGIFKYVDEKRNSTSMEVDNEDFVLEETSVDLETWKGYSLPIMIDFGAKDCIPCKQMAPDLREVHKDMQGKAIIKFIDVWENPDALKDYPVMVIPTQIFIGSDGKPYVPSGDVPVNFDVYNYRETGEHAFTVHQGILTEQQMRDILSDMGVDL